MKKFTLLLLSCSCCLLSLSQDNTGVKPMQEKIDSLTKKLEEHNYTRVPNKDFETILDLKVRSELNNWLDQRKAFILGTVGILSFLLGFLVKFFVTESSRKLLEKQVTEKSQTIDTRIEAFTTQQLRNFNDLNNFMERVVTNFTKDMEKYERMITTNHKELTVGMESLVDQQKKFMEESKQSIEKKFNESLGFIWDDIANGMIERANEKGHNGESLINGFKKLLSTESMKISDNIKIIVIDSLMRCYYHTEGTNNYKKMIELIKTYEHQYDLIGSTYVNAAIALCNYYELYVTKEYRDGCIENCDKAMSKRPDYGIPYAIKMQIFLIDYVKAATPEEKAKAKEDITQLFINIEKIKSALLKGEFLERMILDKKVPYLKEYVDIMEKDFCPQLNRFKETVISTIIVNQHLATEQDMLLLNYLLEEGLNLHPNINGTWQPARYLLSGEEIALQPDQQVLVLKDTEFAFYTNGTKESGIVYFLPGMELTQLNLMFKDGTNKNKTVRAIYIMKDQNNLEVCFGLPGKERPEEFVSEATNNVTLVDYIRA